MFYESTKPLHVNFLGIPLLVLTILTRGSYAGGLMMEKTRDAALVYRMRAGDENAFAELYRCYQRALHGYITQRIGDWRDAEELAQDTFIKVWEHIHTLEDPEKVLNWMYRIAAQLIAGWHRQRKSVSSIESAVDVHEVAGEAIASVVFYQTSEEAAIVRERADALYKAIAQLPERDQQMLRLQSEGQSYREIAERCEVSVSTVRNALPRAKRKLKVWADAWQAGRAEGLDVAFSEVHERKRK